MQAPPSLQLSLWSDSTGMVSAPFLSWQTDRGRTGMGRSRSKPERTGRQGIMT